MTVFKSSKGEVWNMYKNGNTSDIIKVILYADSDSPEFVGNSVKNLYSSNDGKLMENVWTFIKSNIQYRADRKKQVIKSPSYLWKTKTGDCKSFSVAIGAILKHFGIEYKYRFTAYVPGQYTHVYVIAYDRQAKKWRKLDATIERFDYEYPYYKKKDKKPVQSVEINGAGRYKNPIIWVLAGIGLAKYFKWF